MPEFTLATPYGTLLALIAMAGVTYLCRASGVIFMNRITIGPRLSRALRALPGSIVIATILPIAAQAGSPAFIGISAAIAVMIATRMEVAAIAAGLLAISLARFIGL
ncbi:MAG: AzlD domain-containing protein [Salinarimonas sp.]|nr:AzlD domain-containing protein [Salinarimonas sp.]